MSITVITTYIYCLYLDSEQANHFKIGELCLFMMYKLNAKGPVTQTGDQRRRQFSSFQPDHLKNLLHEFKRLHVSWTWHVSKGEGLKRLSNFIILNDF